MELVAEIRPELHRYCARMTGSVFDGEDVLHDTFAKALYALSQMDELPPLRPWLFRIAHNTAMDHLRRYEHRHADKEFDLETVPDGATSEADDDVRVEAALEVFSALPPVQRSALALKDVLGLSLEETAATMGVSVAAVKGALVRARENVRATALREQPRPVQDLQRLRLYAALFNARDWDGLRALFGEETRLDLVSRASRHGPAAAQYWTRYEASAPREDLRADVGWVGGVPAVRIVRSAESGPMYFIRLEWHGDRVARIRDFRYVPYIASEACFTAAGADTQADMFSG